MPAAALAPDPPPPEPPTPLDVGALFDAHGAFVHRVAQRLVGSAALADDLVQEVFLRAWRRRDTLDDRIGVRTWLYRTAVNLASHRNRSDRRYAAAMARLADATDPVAPPAADRDADRVRRARMIRACLARMTDIQREVFVLFELEEVPGAEIALILEVPVNTVWRRLQLAREAFREHWTALGGGPP